tara:strand:+ start:124 stop:660 length:537 start_codon:yes stop_codon:yes gene_type:complete
MQFGFDDEHDSKRTLGIRDKQILYRNAKGKCQNPACGKKIEFDEMQTGHKKAWSRRGKTTLKNSVCLCYRCNKLQGTDSWAKFLKKQGIKDKNATVKESLDGLSISKLKYIAKVKKIKVKGSSVQDSFTVTFKSPSKTKYINAISKKVSDAEVNKLLQNIPKPKKSKKRRRADNFRLF